MNSLPHQLHKHFWDTDPKMVDLQKNSDYVINRLANYGDLESWRWLMSTYQKNQLQDTTRRSRQMTIKTANFFSLLLDIPQREVRCLQPEFRQQHKRSWNR